MSEGKRRFDTLQIHAGQTPDQDTGARAVPIYQTTSYVYESSDHAASLFALETPGYIYSRINNPTVDVLEKRLAALENGVGSVCFASGMAAITGAVLTLASCGDHIVSAATLYGGTYTLFSSRLPKQFGVETTLVDPDNLEALEKAITPKTRLIYIETIGNPNINIPDIPAIAEIAHRHGLPLMADNTFGTPYLFDCKALGIDITVHSLTKYIGGHGTSIGGAVVDLGTFSWDSPRFPDFSTPDPDYHGVVYTQQGDQAYLLKLRAQLLRDTGACLSPFNAFLLLMGMETLSLRLERHCDNALQVAEFLSQHPAVSWVHYPMLPEDPYHERAQRFCPRGAGAILAFGIRGGVAAGRRLMDSMKLFSLLANVADAKSLVIHPASTTHAQLSEEGLLAAGVRPEAVRLSIGLEDIRDILDDLDQALAASQKEDKAPCL